MKKRNLGIIPLLLTVFFLSACGSKASVTSQKAVSDYGTGMAAEVQEVPGNEDIHNERAAGDSAAVSQTSGIESNQVLPAGRKLIRNISMNVETDAFETLLSGLQAKIAEVGGYVEQSDMSGNSLNSYGKPDPRYAGITARIPVNQIDSFMTTVESSGNVTNKTESTQDITLQYSDLESKKKSLEIEQEKLWEFLEKAESVDTVITLQQRLSEVRYQLESMESQLRLYDNQVDYSTVELNISEVTTFTPTATESAGTRIRKGFNRNLKIFQTGAANFMIGTITTSPFWLPIAIAAGAIVFFLRRRRKKTPPALPPALEETACPAPPDNDTADSSKT